MQLQLRRAEEVRERRRPRRPRGGDDVLVHMQHQRALPGRDEVRHQRGEFELPRGRRGAGAGAGRCGPPRGAGVAFGFDHRDVGLAVLLNDERCITGWAGD